MRWRHAAASIGLMLAGCHLVGDYDDLEPPVRTDPVPPQCTSAFECTDDMNPCSQPACLDGECGNVALEQGARCESNEGYCDGAGVCVECVESTQCGSANPICVDSRCVECTEPQHCLVQPGTSCNDNFSCECPGGIGHLWCLRSAGCVDITSSSDNCGACGRRCFGPCVSGLCTGPWEPLPIEDAPSPRSRHVAVSTYSTTGPAARLIVWGGAIGPLATDNTSTGAVYDPLDAYSWTETNIVGAPSPRRDATAVWTGSKMIVWGGHDGVAHLGSGAVFDPDSNSWSQINPSNAPSPRSRHTAVWSGTHMIVWGGTDGIEQLGDGKRYDPDGNLWFDIEAAPGRERHTAAWLGVVSEMIIYGGIGDTTNLSDVHLPADDSNGGMRFSYDATDEQDLGIWAPLETSGEPSARVGHTMVGAGALLVVWGGHDGQVPLDTGAMVNLQLGGAWQPLAGTPPSARSGHTAEFVSSPVWKILHWGGTDDVTVHGDGGELDIDSSPTWLPGAVPAIAPRSGHTSARASRDSVFIWGGVDASGAPLGDGGIYRVGLPPG